MGINPTEFLSQGKVDYLIGISILNQSVKADSERRMAELDYLSKKLSHDIATLFAKML